MSPILRIFFSFLRIVFNAALVTLPGYLPPPPWQCHRSKQGSCTCDTFSTFKPWFLVPPPVIIKRTILMVMENLIGIKCYHLIVKRKSVLLMCFFKSLVEKIDDNFNISWLCYLSYDVLELLDKLASLTFPKLCIYIGTLKVSMFRAFVLHKFCNVHTTMHHQCSEEWLLFMG